MTRPDTLLIEFPSIPHPHEAAARRAETMTRAAGAHATRTGVIRRPAS